MEFNYLRQYLQHKFSHEEIAEEFGVHRPTVERDLTAFIGKNKKRGDGDEKEEKNLRTKSKNTSR